MKSHSRIILVGLLFFLPLLLCTCDLWGGRDNPLDSGAANYQGYPTTTRADNIQLASSWEGIYDPSATVAPTFTCSEVVGATAYELQVSADEIFASIVYQNDTLTTNSASAADLPDGLCRFETYWWRMRAYKDGWGAWSSERSFAYQPTSAVATPALNVAAGAVSYGTVVTFTCETSGATFYFTTDGSKPSNLSATGTSCTLTEAATLTVMAACSGMGNSAVTRAAYTIATSGVSLDKSSETIYVGDTEQLTATVAPATATNQVVTWASSDETVATVSASGVVSAISAGGATITATTDDGGYTASCALTVEVGTRVTGVSLDQTEATVTIGSTTTLAATITPTDASNTSVTWASSDETVATVSGSGVVTGVAAGTATITVTTVNGGYTASCVVTVPPMAVSGVSLDISNISILVGATHVLIATITPVNATNQSLIWASSNESVATVSEGGVTGIAIGTATITVTTMDGGKTATCEITVYEIDAISAGYEYTMILKGDGSLWGSGYNCYGQLGNGTTANVSTPVQVMTEVAEVSTYANHTMIRKNDGSLWATGYNYYGQLGDGTTTSVSTPIQVMTSVGAVSVGGAHTMILKTDGSLWANGHNYSGQLGTGTTTTVYTPVQVMTDVAVVSAGNEFTMILKTDGSLWATGSNNYGQLGNGTTTSVSTPVQVMIGVAAVSAGGIHTMILKTDGTLWATGGNGAGQLGNGTTVDVSTPVQVMTDVAAISADAADTMILKTDGSLWATGYNCYGQLGDGTTTSVSNPMQIMTGVAAVSAATYHTMILKTDGSLWATGHNAHGQFGNGTTADSATPVRIF